MIKRFWINRKRIVNFGLIWMKTAEWLWIKIMFIYKINFCLFNLTTKWQSRLSFYKMTLCYQIQFDQFQNKGLLYWNQRQKQNCYILMEIMLILIIKLKFGLESIHQGSVEKWKLMILERLSIRKILKIYKSKEWQIQKLTVTSQSDPIKQWSSTLKIAT